MYCMYWLLMCDWQKSFIASEWLVHRTQTACTWSPEPYKLALSRPGKMLQLWVLNGAVGTISCWEKSLIRHIAYPEYIWVQTWANQLTMINVEGKTSQLSHNADLKISWSLVVFWRSVDQLFVDWHLIWSQSLKRNAFCIHAATVLCLIVTATWNNEQRHKDSTLTNSTRKLSSTWYLTSSRWPWQGQDGRRWPLGERDRRRLCQGGLCPALRFPSSLQGLPPLGLETVMVFCCGQYKQTS